MTTKKLHRLIAERLCSVITEKRFIIGKDMVLVNADENKNATRVVTYIKGKGSFCDLGLWIGKRFNLLESIVEKYINQIDTLRNPGALTETLAYSENHLKGVYYVSMEYRFEDSEEGVQKIVEKVTPVLTNKLLPFLDKLQTYDQLHLFANTPPDAVSDNLNYFAFDGMTHFRRMIIAKIVNKDYEAICNHVLYTIIEDLKSRKPEHYERFNKVYHELKQELDSASF